MDQALRDAFSNDRLIDITTTGRKSGEQRRIEIMFVYDGKDVYISGQPGPRGWYANILANPKFTLHVKQSLQRDLTATAHPIRDPEGRQTFLTYYQSRFPQAMNEKFPIEKWLRRSPIIRVEFTG